MVAEDSILPFGKYKNRRMKDCPIDYIKWIADSLADTDFHEYAIVAKDYVARYEHELDVEKAADDFLRQHGFNPNNL